MDILIRHNHRKYIVETKIWGGDVRYQTGKAQLAAYLKLEKAVAGYYVVFDHRTQPESRAETDTIDGLTIRTATSFLSYKKSRHNRQPYNQGDRKRT